jgi:hypothetical protein
MKKNLKLFLLVGLVASIGLTSCSEDEETVTPTPVTYGAINSFSAKIMGGQTNATLGSFFASDSGKVYLSGATGASAALQGRIDLVYYFGTANQATLGAPNDSLTNVAHLNNSSLSTWTVKNATKFYKSSLTATSFIGAANDSLVKTVDAALITSSNANLLQVGNVVAFKTAAGKLGLIHVASIDGATGIERSITINVKIQK